MREGAQRSEGDRPPHAPAGGRHRKSGVLRAATRSWLLSPRPACTQKPPVRYAAPGPDRGRGCGARPTARVRTREPVPSVCCVSGTGAGTKLHRAKARARGAHVLGRGTANSRTRARHLPPETRPRETESVAQAAPDAATSNARGHGPHHVTRRSQPGPHACAVRPSRKLPGGRERERGQGPGATPEFPRRRGAQVGVRGREAYAAPGWRKGPGTAWGGLGLASLQGIPRSTGPKGKAGSLSLGGGCHTSPPWLPGAPGTSPTSLPSASAQGAGEAGGQAAGPAWLPHPSQGRLQAQDPRSQQPLPAPPSLAAPRSV